MKILGIDPGYDRLGIAVVERSASGRGPETLIYSDCYTTSPKEDFYVRLGQVGKEVHRIITEYKPDALAIETLFITKNQKTAMHVAETRGVIAYEAVQAGIPIFEYNPGQIKIAVTGHGASDKTQVMKMIPLLVKIDLTDKKNSSKKGIDDEYDAIAVALTCLAHEKSLLK
jgi:crossover junction endodeoxyribonuclease RuvC